MDIIHIDNSWEKFCFEAEDGDKSLLTWKIWVRRVKWEKFEHVGDLMRIVYLREGVGYMRERRNN